MTAKIRIQFYMIRDQCNMTLKEKNWKQRLLKISLLLFHVYHVVNVLSLILYRILKT